MFTKKLMLTFAFAALSVASAASSHRITVFQTAYVNGAELKPGEYKVEVHDNKAVITRGKESFDAPVRVESAPNKFPTTTVRYNNANGKMQVDEIRIGGTSTRLVFSPATVSEVR
jgi:hypothetical protein